LVQVKKEKLDVKCNTCNEHFDSIRQLSGHIKQVHLVNRRCRTCAIDEFCSWKDFQVHHLRHVRQPSVRLQHLGPEYTIVTKPVAKKSTTAHHREPIKLTLRLTNCRKAKAAEERFEQERRQSAEASESKMMTDTAFDVLQQELTRSSQPSPSASLPASSPASIGYAQR
jgi:hypothetical protein